MLPAGYSAFKFWMRLAFLFSSNWLILTKLWPLIQSWNFSDETLVAYGMIIWHFIVFYGVNAFFIILDRFKIPKYFYEYKIQKDITVSNSDYIKCLKNNLFNQTFILIPLFTLGTPIFIKAGWYSGPIPSLYIIIRDFLVYILCEEVGFYYSHVLLHKGFLYHNVHKVHHQFQAPIGLASIYSHPVEFVFSNLIPVILGPLLIRSHIAVIYAWVFTALSTTINGHSGFDLPIGILGVAGNHDYHHEFYTGNFGAVGLLDWFHGTRKYKKDVKPVVSNDDKHSQTLIN